MERTQGKKAGTKTTDRGDNKTQTRHRQGKAEGTGMSEEQPKTQTTSKCQDTTTEKENAHTAQGNTSQETTAAPKRQRHIANYGFNTYRFIVVYNGF